MDHMIYTAMTGAKHILEQQATTSHNLANVNSTGFRAQVDAFRAVPVVSDALPTKTFVVDSTIGANFQPGIIQQTSRSLDVAIQNEGWLVVQRDNGSEGYTRNGSLKVSENGVLQTENGKTIMGDGGPISIPPDVTITIAKDGTVSAVNNTTLPGPSNILGRLKLVNPNEKNLVRGEDGLFQNANGQPSDADSNVSVISGALEGSNVNVVESMVDMISLARQFDLQMKLVKEAENNDSKATQILSMS